MSFCVVLLGLSWLNLAPPVLKVCGTSDSSLQCQSIRLPALFKFTVRLTSNIAEDGKPLSSEGESQTYLQGRNSVKDLCFLLSPVHASVIVVLPLTGGEA